MKSRSSPRIRERFGKSAPSAPARRKCRGHQCSRASSRSSSLSPAGAGAQLSCREKHVEENREGVPRIQEMSRNVRTSPQSAPAAHRHRRGRNPIRPGDGGRCSLRRPIARAGPTLRIRHEIRVPGTVPVVRYRLQGCFGFRSASSSRPHCRLVAFRPGNDPGVPELSQNPARNATCRVTTVFGWTARNPCHPGGEKLKVRFTAANRQTPGCRRSSPATAECVPQASSLSGMASCPAARQAARLRRFDLVRRICELRHRPRRVQVGSRTARPMWLLARSIPRQTF